jgi:Zn-dependent protease
LFNLTPAVLISRAIVLLVAMTVHEFAHAYIAYRMGDSTAKEMGRMTLDPRANINVYGFIVGVLIGFGVLGSAPVNPYRMRNRRLGMFLAVLAGPVSNLILGALFALPFRFGVIPNFMNELGDGFFLPSPVDVLYQMIFLNVLLFVFNILPLYPLDGWTIMLAALPPNMAIWWERNKQTNMYIFFGLIALAFISPQLSAIGLGFLDPLGWLIWQPTEKIINLLIGS